MCSACVPGLWLSCKVADNVLTFVPAVTLLGLGRHTGPSRPRKSTSSGRTALTFLHVCNSTLVGKSNQCTAVEKAFLENPHRFTQSQLSSLNVCQRHFSLSIKGLTAEEAHGQIKMILFFLVNRTKRENQIELLVLWMCREDLILQKDPVVSWMQQCTSSTRANGGECNKIHGGTWALRTLNTHA